MKLARIGQSEKQLAQNLQIHSETINLADWFTYRRINDPVAMLKLVYNQEGQIIAITCLSSIADELINLCYLILEKQLTHQEIEALIFAYPTPASDLTYIILNAGKRSCLITKCFLKESLLQTFSADKTDHHDKLRVGFFVFMCSTCLLLTFVKKFQKFLDLK